MRRRNTPSAGRVLPDVQRIPLLVLVAILLAVPACDLLAGSDEIDGEWVLVSGSLDGEPIRLVDDARVTMSIDGSQVGGVAACNHYGGEIEREGSHISIGMLAVTEMGCLGGLMSVESAYLEALTRVDVAERSGNRLRLTGVDAELVYDPVTPVPGSALVGTRWILESLVTGDAVASIVEEPELVLGENGTVSGSTGCRSFSGAYQINGATLVFTELVLDMRACDDLLGSQDAHVISVLESRPMLSIDGRQLVIDGGDAGLVYRAEE